MPKRKFKRIFKGKVRKFKRIFKGKVRKFKRIFKGKVITNSAEYYSLVYEDLVDYKTIDSENVRSDEDLKKFLNTKPQTSSDKLFNKLRKTDIHRELVNENLGKVDKFQLKDKKIVTIQRKKDKKFYVINNRMRDLFTGRFIKI